MMDIPHHWTALLTDIAKEAGALILHYRESGFNVQSKADASPVTQADEAADKFIVSALQQLTPDIAIISEEGSHKEDAAGCGQFWCVDPLDGTKNFIRGGAEFTVNIALIDQNRPIVGVIYIPVSGELYYTSQGKACKNAGEIITVSKYSATNGTHVLMSHFHKQSREQLLRERYNVTQISTASSSLKFCRVAEGAADIYPRFGNTMEWDTAAGHAILRAAGGEVYTMNEEGKASMPLGYGKPGFRNNGFIAAGNMHVIMKS